MYAGCVLEVLFDNSQLYGALLPILDAIDELIGDMSLSLDSPWKVEYVKKSVTIISMVSSI